MKRRVLNIGSLNIDNVFSMEHFVQPGETLSANNFQVFPGGKGLNQSIALSRAGCEVFHAGKIGKDGEGLVHLLQENGVDTNLIEIGDADTGKAIIQVDRAGQNCIILYEGTNKTIGTTYIHEVLNKFGSGDMLLLQNEVNNISEMINRGYEKDMVVVLNPSPIGEEIYRCDFNKITYLILNEVEGEALTGEKEAELITQALLRKYPNLRIVLTLGMEGACYCDKEQFIRQAAYPVEAVDTTAAGDTFTGYFLRCIIDGMPVKQALNYSSLAASITVARKGAAVSIPWWKEVKDKMQTGTVQG